MTEERHKLQEEYDAAEAKLAGLIRLRDFHIRKALEATAKILETDGSVRKAAVQAIIDYDTTHPEET